MGRRSRAVALVGALALVLAACGQSGEESPPSDSDDRLSIVATTTIWGDVVNEIVGDRADVTVLMPIGVDPHAFQASARQAAEIQEADVVISNGLGLEQGLTVVLDNAEDEGVRVLQVAEHVDPIAFGSSDDPVCEAEEGHDEDHGDDEEEGHDHGPCDPHVWLDPARVMLAVDEIEAILTELDPATEWTTSADDYRSALADTLSEMTATLDAVPEDKRKLITNHDSLTYFADRFGFEVVGAIIPGGSTLGDASSQDLTELVDTIEREGISTIFSETTEPDRLAQALSDETGGAVSVVELYTGSLGQPGSGAETLIDMLATNATLVADGLGG